MSDLYGIYVQPSTDTVEDSPPSFISDCSTYTLTPDGEAVEVEEDSFQDF